MLAPSAKTRMRRRTGAGESRLADWPCLAVCLSLVLAGTAAFSIDLALARRAHEQTWPKALTEQLQRAEVFGYGVTVAVILLVVFVLDPARRRLMPRLLLMVYGSGLAANCLKLMLARARPRNFEFQGSVWATFGDFLALGRGGSAMHSFPSAHTATAVGLAVALSMLYPRGRWLFGALAVLVGLQRVVAGAHFLSDALFGAALGWLVAMTVARSSLGRLGRWETASPGLIGPGETARLIEE